ncbi:MAG: hypothetical protein JNL98_14450 [Bryobacterales bacterium]|nr:hypothetical protein [Bryobacterales bacterium]
MAEARVAPEQALTQVETIRNSATFRNKESLRRLLSFLAARTMDGSAEGLKEYSLGLEVFGKPEAYDPQSDPSVRVQVGKLRQKLEEYYLAEGLNDPVVVELPRRQFLLRFHTREQPANGEVAPAAAPLPNVSSAVRRPLRWVAAGAITLAAVTIAGAGFLLGRQTSPPAPDPVPDEVRRFWQPFLDSQRPVLVCLGTPMFVRFEGARLRIGSAEEPADILNNPKIKSIQQALGSRAAQPSYVFTGVGEAYAAFALSRIFTRWQRDLELRRNNALTWDEMSAGNLIFLGSAKYNPQLRQLPVAHTFLVEQRGVTNRSPAPGEQAQYLRGYSDNEERQIIEDYAVVSRLPGIQGRGEVVILGASSTEGTWAAAQYATQPEGLRELFAKVKTTSGEIPRHFEALVRVRFREMVPVSFTYITHRVYKPVATSPN